MMSLSPDKRGRADEQSRDAAHTAELARIRAAVQTVSEGLSKLARDLERIAEAVGVVRYDL